MKEDGYAPMLTVCWSCGHTMSQGKLPTNAMANGNDVGFAPYCHLISDPVKGLKEYLPELSQMEQQLLVGVWVILCMLDRLTSCFICAVAYPMSPHYNVLEQ